MSEKEMNETIAERVQNRVDVLTLLCFEAIFVDTLLVDQYKITGPEFERIEFMKQIPVSLKTLADNCRFYNRH